MSKVYLADKDTLDSVNDKVGTSSDTASSSPTTLFAGIKHIIQGVMDLKKLLSDGKTAVANAITGKGVTTATDAAFATMAANIAAISTLATDTADATATAAQILSGKTAYVKGAKITGTIASKAAATYTPGTTDQTIAAGQYLAGVQTIKGDAKLKSENIKSGTSIFGVNGGLKDLVSLFSSINGYEYKSVDLKSNTTVSITFGKTPKLIIYWFDVNSSDAFSNTSFIVPDAIWVHLKKYQSSSSYVYQIPIANTEMYGRYHSYNTTSYFQFSSDYKTLYARADGSGIFYTLFGLSFY